jgi:NAD(P)-dependent dehydrogenase (short-subunit alcohol dehydrogenase family)
VSSAVVVGTSGAIGRALCDRIAASGLYQQTFAFARSPVGERAADQSSPIDITDEQSVAEAANLMAKQAPVSLVVVASGLLHGPGISPEKSIAAIDPTVMHAVFAVNTIGPALVAKHFVPLMPRQGRSVFAALSARVGSIEDNRLGGWYSYRASKAALNQVLRTLAIEVARTRPEAIVAGLHPGTVISGLSAPFRSAESKPAPFTPEVSAGHLFDVLNRLSPRDSGRVFAWDNQRIPF